VRLDVRKLRSDEHRLAAGLTARAFRDNPTSVAMFGEEPLERFFRMQLLWTAFFRNPPQATRGVFYQGCMLGVASAASPGQCIGHRLKPVQDSDEPPAGDPARQAYLQGIYARHDLPEAHHHIGPVAVEPNFQGRGIGSALMRGLVASLDAPSWFETDTELNVRFYTALGYTVVHKEDVFGLPLWFMRRG